MQDPRSIPAPKPEQRPIPQRNQLIREAEKRREQRFAAEPVRHSAFGELGGVL